MSIDTINNIRNNTLINNNLKFLIISHVVHKKISDGIFAAYGPYVKEMNLWFKYVDTVTIVAPISNSTADKIDIEYSKKINLVEVAEINLTNKKTLIKSLIYLPSIFYKTIKAMAKADHIHLRCPGNMGLVGCVAQILYPKTKKTTKFAGNWDKNSKQPWSYQLQKWILNNTYLTKNMQVMVYGKWEDSSKNIVPFFTASYTEALKIPIPDKTFSANAPIRLIFVGALS